MVSMVMSFVLSFFPRGVLDDILNLIESFSEGFPSYSRHKSQVLKGLTFFHAEGTIHCVRLLPFIAKHDQERRNRRMLVSPDSRLSQKKA